MYGVFLDIILQMETAVLNLFINSALFNSSQSCPLLDNFGALKASFVLFCPILSLLPIQSNLICLVLGSFWAISCQFWPILCHFWLFRAYSGGHWPIFER